MFLTKGGRLSGFQIADRVHIFFEGVYSKLVHRGGKRGTLYWLTDDGIDHAIKIAKEMLAQD